MIASRVITYYETTDFLIYLLTFMSIQPWYLLWIVIYHYFRLVLIFLPNIEDGRQWLEVVITLLFLANSVAVHNANIDLYTKPNYTALIDNWRQQLPPLNKTTSVLLD